MPVLQMRAPWAPEWGAVAVADTLGELADYAALALCDGELYELPGCPWSGDYTAQPECIAIDAAAEGVVQCLRWLAEFGTPADALARIELPMPYGIELRLTA